MLKNPQWKKLGDTKEPINYLFLVLQLAHYYGNPYGLRKKLNYFKSVRWKVTQ